MHRVFVYGTLRQGFRNHRLLETSPYVSTAVTADSFALYVSRYPYVTDREQVCPIVGEVYDVDEETFARLDELEGHPEHYVRRHVGIHLSSGETTRAWMYFLTEPGGVFVDHGDYARWRAEKRQD